MASFYGLSPHLGGLDWGGSGIQPLIEGFHLPAKLGGLVDVDFVTVAQSTHIKTPDAALQLT